MDLNTMQLHFMMEEETQYSFDHRVNLFPSFLYGQWNSTLQHQGGRFEQPPRTTSIPLFVQLGKEHVECWFEGCN